MSDRFARLILIIALGVVFFSLTACHNLTSPVIGRWRDQSPAALRYEFRGDGSVWLLREGQDLPVFRYEVEREEILRLYDGMGREREFYFTIVGDRFILREASREGAIYAEYRREQ